MGKLIRIIEDGGWPGFALVGVSIFLWMVVWLRASNLTSSVEHRFTEELRRAEVSSVPALLLRSTDRLGSGRGLLRALVVLAPLLGLLGTVGGMVELFDSLHGGTTVVGRGSVAGGISKALVTTQLGLIVGVPGLIAARFLEQRERELCGRLQKIVPRGEPPS